MFGTTHTIEDSTWVSGSDVFLRQVANVESKQMDGTIMLAINGQMLHNLTYVSKQSSVSLYRGSGQPNDGVYSFNCVGVAFVSDLSKVHLQNCVCCAPERKEGCTYWLSTRSYNKAMSCK